MPKTVLNSVELLARVPGTKHCKSGSNFWCADLPLYKMYCCRQLLLVVVDHHIQQIDIQFCLWSAEQGKNEFPPAP